jgi:Histidine kinase-, DNA gyrase B-, and HSP90-like ATPase
MRRKKTAMKGSNSISTNARKHVGGDDGETATPSSANALPTKEFFISVLTRDIELSRAILDLVDNCVDGARRLRGDPDRASGKHPSASPNLYKGLTIELTVKPGSFVIEDNCGGIPIEIAEHYAFRFGRDRKQTLLPHSIGHFGIGMKRALFKLGDHFRIESTTPDTRFIIDEKVSSWKKRDDDWQFKFTSVETDGWSQAETGTTITVKALHPNVAEDFGRDNFVSHLHEIVGSALQVPIAMGLEATVNEVVVVSEMPVLSRSKTIKPVARTIEYGPKGPSHVRVRLYAGVGEGDLHGAGWNVYCNGRLVLASDQSATTGWGAAKPVSIPSYHNEFHRFHGFVFFDAEDAGALPWNTPKTGIDTDSPIFRRVKTEMILAMRPVIDMLNALKVEENPSSKPTTRTATKAYERAKPLPLRELPKQATFSWPVSKGRIDAKEALILIRYQKLRTAVDRAKRLLGVTTPEAVGEATFEFWEDRQK